VLLIGLIAALQVAPAPPPIAPATPPIVRSPIQTDAALRRPTVNIRVRIEAGAQHLFADRLRVGGLPASYNQSRTEAPAEACPDLRRSTLLNNLGFTIVPAFGNREADYRVTFRWNRAPSEGCTGGQRTVSLEQVVTLEPGRTVTIEGDAGVRIELTRER